MVVQVTSSWKYYSLRERKGKPQTSWRYNCHFSTASLFSWVQNTSPGPAVPNRHNVIAVLQYLAHSGTSTVSQARYTPEVSAEGLGPVSHRVCVGVMTTSHGLTLHGCPDPPWINPGSRGGGLWWPAEVTFSCLPVGLPKGTKKKPMSTPNVFTVSHEL